MFNSLKTFMFGGTAGSVAAPKTNTPANNSAVQPEMQRMMRTKRKRDSSRTEDGTDMRGSGRSGVLMSDNEDVEPLAKKPKVENTEATAFTPVSNAVFAETDNVRSSETPSRKRRRSSDSAADGTPFKRMRQDGDDLTAEPGVDLDATQETQHGELDDLPHELPTAPNPIDLIDEDAVAPENDATSSQSTEGTLGDEDDVVAGDVATGLVNIVQQYRAATIGVSHGLLSSASYKPSKRFRRQAKKYVKLGMAHGNDREGQNVHDDGEVESLFGIGSWPGSSNVPGSLRQEPHDAKDRIEMPPRKPRLVDWGQFEERERPSWVQRRRAACEA